MLTKHPHVSPEQSDERLGRIARRIAASVFARHWTLDAVAGPRDAFATACPRLAQKGQFNVHDWSRVEILADAAKGIARMAVAQPVGAKAIEVLRFRDPAAGKSGPIAWQMHNAGLFDEFKGVAIEVDPAEDELISMQ